MMNLILKGLVLPLGICGACLIFLPVLGPFGPILILGTIAVLAGKAGGDGP